VDSATGVFRPTGETLAQSQSVCSGARDARPAEARRDVGAAEQCSDPLVVHSVPTAASTPCAPTPSQAAPAYKDRRCRKGATSGGGLFRIEYPYAAQPGPGSGRLLGRVGSWPGDGEQCGPHRVAA